MRSFTACMSVLAFLLPTVTARRGGGGGGGSFESTSTHFEAPPLETADLAFDAIFFVITLIQLGISIPHVSRVPFGHRLPGVSIILALVFLALAYAFAIANSVANWTVDDFGEPSIPYLASLNIGIAGTLFWDWVDAMVFAAVALVLRDRYLAPAPKTEVEQTSRKSVPLLPFTIASCLVFGIMWILPGALVGIWGSADTRVYNLTLSPSEATHQIDISNDVFYAFIAVSFVAAIFLLAFAIVVKMRNKSDKITTLTLTIIVPILILRVIARIINTILQVRLPLSPSYTPEEGYALDFSSDFIYGVFHAAAMTVLVYFLMVPRLWGEVSHVQPQFVGYAVPQQPYSQGGMLPPAQFPGQWGFTAQPQQQYGYPASYANVYPQGPNIYPQGPDGYSQGPNVYPNQHPQMAPPPAPSPGEEKAVDGTLHPYSNQTPPPPAS